MSADERTRALCHDLRQPVAAILAMVSAARQAAGDPEETGRWLDRIEMEALWLGDLARTALEADAHPGAGRPVDLDDVVVAAVAAMDGGPAGSVQVTRAGRPLWVRGDAVQLGRAVRNVLGNAVRAGGPQAAARVTVRAGGGYAAVQVDDDGPGFARIPAGTGLGLRIADEALRHSGGRLSICDLPTGGVRVLITVPLAAAVPAPRTGPP